MSAFGTFRHRLCTRLILTQSGHQKDCPKGQLPDIHPRQIGVRGRMGVSERPKALVTAKRSNKMRLRLICTAFTISLLPVAANAQITIDMGAIRCDQYLAMSPAQSRDFSAWMSGWFSYQTRREFVDIELHQKNIANLKAWCQYHPQEGVMAGLQRGIGPTQ